MKPIPDAQALALLATILNFSAESVKEQKVRPNVYPNGLVSLQGGLSFTDDKTKQKFHAMVFVVASEDEEFVKSQIAKHLPKNVDLPRDARRRRSPKTPPQ